MICQSYWATRYVNTPTKPYRYPHPLTNLWQFLPRPKTLFLERYYFHRLLSVLVSDEILHIYLGQKLCFWTGIIFIGVIVSVCVSVCERLPRLTQKVLDRFWWNLSKWCIMIKDRFLSKMKWINLVEGIPRPFEMLK